MSITIPNDFFSKPLQAQQLFLHEAVEYNNHDLSGDFYLGILENSSDPLCKWYAIKALGNLRFVKGISLIIEVLKEKNVDFDGTSLHLISAYSLGRIGPIALPSIKALLASSPSEATKKAAIDSLGEIGSAESIPLLINSIKSESTEIALWAALSISKIGLGSKDLQKVYSELSSEKRLIVIDSLVRLGDDDSMQYVIKALQHDSLLFEAFINSNSMKSYTVFLDYLEANNLKLESLFPCENE